jgi:uncharacterized protein (TIGR01777 family)
MAETVLITGGTGMIGQRLTQLLLAKGYQVAYLSREQQSIPNVKIYRWNIEKKFLEEGALREVDYIVHLAGAGIADQRWSSKRKQEIIKSRTQSIELIARRLQERPYNVKACVSASGIGFYGADTGDTRVSEQSVSGSDFVAHVTRHWEKSVELIDTMGIRTVKLRTGIVLSTEGGALPKMALPVQWGVGAPLASGKQWISWIHIDDLCRLYIEAMENPQWHGIYNAVASTPVTNETFTRQVAEVLHRPLWLPNIPSVVLKTLFGEMSSLVIGGNYVINQRIKAETNFIFQFNDLKIALLNLYGK